MRKDDVDRLIELRQALNDTPPCKTDPDAPHGFDRNASHSADRYVCECEGWEPDVDNSAHKAEEWVGLTDDEIVDLVFSVDSYKGLVQATEAKLKEKNT